MTVAPLSDAQGPGLTEDAIGRRKLWRELAEKRIEQGVDWPSIVLTLFRDLDQSEARVRAASRTALIEAADEMPLDYRDHPPQIWVRGESGTGTDVYVSDWLRARAATYDAGDEHG